MSKLVYGLLSVPLWSALILAGCATTGPQRAAKLASRVEDTRQALQQTKIHIQGALAAASAMGETEGGKLESDFKHLDSEVKDTGEKVIDFRNRMAEMNKASDDYFVFWATELDKYTTDELRKRDEARLEETRGRYKQLVTAMQRPDEKLNPFWARLHDLVLFLNHNLNPQGVSSVQDTMKKLNADAADLYPLIDAALAEADNFAISLGP